ncbi:MAG: hypothetical protein K2X74_00525 [Acetobacteraceae bacterium]|nr:hypothetical protein [Acetobacteraceae bacterium]
MAKRGGFNSVSLVSGQQYVYRRGLPIEVPIPLEPASWAGALLYGDDGEVHWSNGLEWRSTAAYTQQLPEDITVEVGTGTGPLIFPDLADAVSFLSRYVPSAAGITRFRTGTILIKAGHVCQKQVILDGVPMGWVRIISEDAEVMVDEAALTDSAPFGTTQRPFIAARSAATCPRVKTLFRCDPDAGLPQSVGLLLDGGYYADDTGTDAAAQTVTGFEGFWRNTVVTRGAVARFVSKSFNDARDRNVIVGQHAHANLSGCRAIGVAGSGICVDIDNGGMVVLTSPIATIPNANVYRADPAGLADSDFDIRAARSSIVMIDSSGAGILGGTGRLLASAAFARYFDTRETAVQYQGVFAPKSYTVAGAPSAAAYPANVIHVSNGNAGAPCLAVSNGTNWLRVALGAAISAT